MYYVMSGSLNSQAFLKQHVLCLGSPERFCSGCVFRSSPPPHPILCFFLPLILSMSMVAQLKELVTGLQDFANHRGQYFIWGLAGHNRSPWLPQTLTFHLKCPNRQKFYFLIWFYISPNELLRKKNSIWVKCNLFLDVLKMFKFAAILVHHSHQSSLGLEWVVTYIKEHMISGLNHLACFTSVNLI